MTSTESDKAIKGQPHRGPNHSAPYPASRLAPAMERVDLAREIARADEMLSARTEAKLRVIADQVKALQAEARKILEEAGRHTELNHARCSFRKVPGKVYHLYRETDGGLTFSMLSPEDWNGSPPNEYRGAYRLEANLSWTSTEQVDRPDDSGEWVKRLLRGGTKAISVK